MTTDEPDTTGKGSHLPQRWFDWLQAHDVLTRLLHWPGTPQYLEPRTEGFVGDRELVVRLEMAGLDPEQDIEVQVSDHTLHIRAERREEREHTGKGRYWSEFRYGRVARDIPLPPGATEGGVKATYKDGILELRVPIDHAQAGAAKITVQRV